MANRFDFNSNRNNESGGSQSSRDSFVKGNLLLASPYLQESPFSQTVVLLLQHSKNGSFGVVLNRAADDRIKAAWHQLTGLEIDRRIVAGGPVGGPVFAIHQSQAAAEMEMPGGIFVTASSDALKSIVRANEFDYRIVFGVAAWQPGQLDREMLNGYWYSMPAEIDCVFDDPEWMWEKAISRYGRECMKDLLGLEELPEDPTIN